MMLIATDHLEITKTVVEQELIFVVLQRTRFFIQYLFSILISNILCSILQVTKAIIFYSIVK